MKALKKTTRLFVGNLRVQGEALKVRQEIKSKVIKGWTFHNCLSEIHLPNLTELLLVGLFEMLKLLLTSDGAMMERNERKHDLMKLENIEKVGKQLSPLLNLRRNKWKSSRSGPTSRIWSTYVKNTITKPEFDVIFGGFPPSKPYFEVIDKLWIIWQSLKGSRRAIQALELGAISSLTGLVII